MRARACFDVGADRPAGPRSQRPATSGAPWSCLVEAGLSPSAISFQIRPRRPRHVSAFARCHFPCLKATPPFARARTLRPRTWRGKAVVRFESVYPALTRVHDDRPLTAMTVEKVESMGKHILMHFSGGLVLRTHMRMHGSWHIYRPGERWRQRAGNMRVLVATSTFEAVGFSIPVAEFIRARDLEKHKVLARLGPDALGTSFDREEAVRRLRTQSSSPVGEALLNQRLLAGLGNVLKSEVLFSCGINPFVSIATLDDRSARRCWSTPAGACSRPTWASRRRASPATPDSAGRPAGTIRASVCGCTGARVFPAVDAARRSKSGNTARMRG